MNAFTSAAIINIALFILIGATVCITHDGWPIFGLICMVTAERKPAITEKDDDDHESE